MASIEATRAQVALVAMYLGKSEARDKLCRAIQYASKFISAGEKGTAQDVEKQVSLARKVFRLLKVSASLLLAIFMPVLAQNLGESKKIDVRVDNHS